MQSMHNCALNKCPFQVRVVEKLTKIFFFTIKLLNTIKVAISITEYKYCMHSHVGILQAFL